MLSEETNIGVFAIGTALAGFVGGYLYATSNERIEVDQMPTHVCAACGKNVDYTHAAPDECPACGGSLIATA